MNALSLDTVVLSEDTLEIIILDQTLLPGEIKYLHLSKAEDIWEAIYALRVRGAPAIGVAAAYGIYVVTAQLQTDNMEEFCNYFRRAKSVPRFRSSHSGQSVLGSESDEQGFGGKQADHDGAAVEGAAAPGGPHHPRRGYRHQPQYRPAGI